MIVIGIVGGIASGKSLVAEQFRALGAEVLDADQLGHEVLDELDVREAVRRRWGEQVFHPGGRINRRMLAGIVFGAESDAPKQLAYLEEITHPLIGQRLREQLETLARRPDHLAAVLDAPVMFKAGWDAVCDKIVFVDAPRLQRLARARQRGWSGDDLAAREAAQESLDQKRQFADVVVDNSGAPEQTFEQVRRLWAEWVEQG